MWQFFEFESDFVASLRCIPMQVRYKLDTCGVKLKLQHWHSFSELQRHLLIDLSCETDAEVIAYREKLRSLVWETCQDCPKDLPIDQVPAWMQVNIIPESVLAHTQELNVAIALSQWQSLTSLQRFALIKLSTSNHENNNFLPALTEFGILIK
ncbi:MAG: nitrate reductase associated protein [Oscillatoriales cyanobacterium CG2_30_44_21]|nr:MAG: nitrate reductase associated protein [Oscillatoriales cyanobacterium CG2_30_44_21]